MSKHREEVDLYNLSPHVEEEHRSHTYKYGLKVPTEQSKWMKMPLFNFQMISWKVWIELCQKNEVTKQENNKKEYIWKPDRHVFNIVVMQRQQGIIEKYATEL